MRYEIFESDRLDELQDDVNDAISEGWRPIGGVAIFRYEWTNERKGYTEAEWKFAQAMILDDRTVVSESPVTEKEP